MTTPSDSFEFSVRGERVEITRGLLERCAVAGPRYTSYPTAPEWQARTPAAAVAALDRLRRPGDTQPLSLYVHIPYCHVLCYFCGCTMVVSTDAAKHASYLDTVLAEMDLVSEHVETQSRPVTQVHWGGGTPTSLAPEQLIRLQEHARRRFRVVDEAEVSVEIDPRVTTTAQLDALKSVGFTRISMGVQDFNPKVQRTINRIQPYETTAALIEHARAIGLKSINVDLIYGLPFQTPETFADTLEKVARLDPDRVALFNYAHVPWLKKHQKLIPTEALPSGDARLSIFTGAVEFFTGHGYRFIGLDHFAKETDELARAHDNRTLYRNFQGYSTHRDCDLLAFGNSAIANFGREYAQNVREVKPYREAIARGELATVRGTTLTDDDLVRRDLITRLLCHDEIHKAEIERDYPSTGAFDTYFAADLARLKAPIDDGLVTEHDGGRVLRVTTLGRLFIRNVAMCFDAYLHREGAHTRFSTTV